MIIEFVLFAVAGFFGGLILYWMLRGTLQRRGLENILKKIKNQEKQDFIIDGKKYNLVEKIQEDLVKTIGESQMAQQIIPTEQTIEEPVEEPVEIPIEEAPIKKMEFPPLPKPMKLPSLPKKKKKAKVKISVADLLNSRKMRR